MNNTDTYGQPYDYVSVMHYGEYAFTNGNGKTMQARKPGIIVGSRENLTQIDIRKLNAHGRCSTTTKPGDKHVFVDINTHF